MADASEFYGELREVMKRVQTAPEALEALGALASISAAMVFSWYEPYARANACRSFGVEMQKRIVENAEKFQALDNLEYVDRIKS